jgi:phosphoglycolate phosphatase
MTLSGVRLLALDLDGTIKSKGKPVRKDVLAKLKKLRAKGIRLVLATGRCLEEIEAIVDPDGFDAVVAENGAILLGGGKKQLLSPRGWARTRAELLTHFKPGCEEVVISLDRKLTPEVRRVVGTRATVQVNKDRVMILPRGVTKGTGLSAAVKLLKEAGPIACVGDGENDLAMFEASDYAIALGNSVPPLKKLADYVSPLPDGRGTIDAISRLFLGHPIQGLRGSRRPVARA